MSPPEPNVVGAKAEPYSLLLQLLPPPAPQPACPPPPPSLLDAQGPVPAGKPPPVEDRLPLIIIEALKL